MVFSSNENEETMMSVVDILKAFTNAVKAATAKPVDPAYKPVLPKRSPEAPINGDF